MKVNVAHTLIVALFLVQQFAWSNASTNLLAQFGWASMEDSCASWANSGECDFNPSYMWTHCSAACVRVSDGFGYTDDAHSAEQTWYLDLVNVPEVWNELGITGEGVQVYVWDDGFSVANPDLVNQFRMDDSCPSELENGLDHGTMVAGLIAAEANNEFCGAGVAPGATLAGCTWMRKTHQPGRLRVASEYENDLDFLYKFHDNHISQNSWGYFDFCKNPDDEGYRRLMADDDGADGVLEVLERFRSRRDDNQSGR